MYGFIMQQQFFLHDEAIHHRREICAISSPMHTSVCISLLRALSRHNNYQVTNNNVEFDQLYSRSVQTVLGFDRLFVCGDVDSAWLLCAHVALAACELFSVGVASRDPFPAFRHFVYVYYVFSAREGAAL